MAQTRGVVSQLTKFADEWKPGEVSDQDDRSPMVLFACADILLKWYEAEPGRATRSMSPEQLVEVILEDMATSLTDLLANKATDAIDACAEYPAGYVKPRA